MSGLFVGIVALRSFSGMGLLLSLVILGNFLVKISIFNVKVGFFFKRKLVASFVKSEFVSISGLGFSNLYTYDGSEACWG